MIAMWPKATGKQKSSLANKLFLILVTIAGELPEWHIDRNRDADGWLSIAAEEIIRTDLLEHWNETWQVGDHSRNKLWSIPSLL